MECIGGRMRLFYALDGPTANLAQESFRPHHNLTNIPQPQAVRTSGCHSKGETRRCGEERKGRMKRLIAMAIVALTAIEFVSAAPTVTDITAKQRYPWNGLVDITCKVSGIEADTGGYEFAVVAVGKDTGKEYTVSNFSVKHSGENVSGLDVYENGDYSLLWNAREDMGQVVIERVTVRIALEALAEDEVAEDEDLDTHKKVQLWAGGPYWADRNIGASKPWKYGRYFWWGDTIGHTSGYNFSQGNTPTYGKDIATLKSEEWITADGVLAPSHDAAHVKWGGSWRMPTKEESEDLGSKCDWTWTTLNGVEGYKVRGRGGYATKSIFLPAIGWGVGTRFYQIGRVGSYWSSVPASDDRGGGAFEPRFDPENGPGMNISSRSHARAIRPVQGFAN